MFENKILLITGGTGSFGNAVLRRFLDTDIKEIRIFSRDEKKQDDMRHLYHLTSTMRHPKTISKNSHQIIGLWTDAFSSEALSWSSYFRLLAGIPLS